MKSLNKYNVSLNDMQPKESVTNIVIATVALLASIIIVALI